MIYVLELSGKGSNSKADNVTLHIFEDSATAVKFMTDHSRPSSEWKYWTNFEIVIPGGEISTYDPGDDE